MKVTDYISGLYNMITGNKDKKKVMGVDIPAGRVSIPTNYDSQSINNSLNNRLSSITPTYPVEVIPLIRKLKMYNEDMGLVIHDSVTLTNTGWEIVFDKAVKTEQQIKMRDHLKEKIKSWGDGVDGLNGLINKAIAQIWVSGAVSGEWVFGRDITKGIENMVLVNPETIRWVYDKRKGRYFPYQTATDLSGKVKSPNGLKKLNINSYKYFGLGGDTEIPYGEPPLLTALKAISVQGDMDENIADIMKQLGLLGFLELKITKPDQQNLENDDAYKRRLEKMLSEAKTNIEKSALRDGIVVGFDGDHEYNFNSTTKNLSGIDGVYTLNQRKVANGLKTPGIFIGSNTSGKSSEGNLSIIFTKMLSQLNNVQSMISAFFEYGFALELISQGFQFKTVTLKFKPSTITDELKIQQSNEYKIRNIYNKYLMGIISLETAAEELGYEKPDQKEPRAPIDQTGKEKEDRKDDKGDSAKKSRDKDKKQPKSK